MNELVKVRMLKDDVIAGAVCFKDYEFFTTTEDAKKLVDEEKVEIVTPPPAPPQMEEHNLERGEKKK